MGAKQQFRQLDEKFEHFLDNVLVEVVETELTPEKRAVRRKRADADDLEFCKIYFPRIFNLEWNELHLRTANLAPGMYTRSGFRKCGKSAFSYITLIVKPIAQNIRGLVGINCQTLEDLAKERTAAFKRIIMRNQLLCFDYDIELNQDMKGHYIFRETHLVSGSVNKGLRAMMDDEFIRFKRIVNDDLYDATNVASANHTARVVEFIESECSGQLEDDGICVTLGNATAENAPIVTLREKNPKNHFGLPALDEDNESGWPEYIEDAEAWDDYREKKSISYSVWLGDYMDKPGLQGDILDPDWIRPVNLNLIKIVAAISAADPAHGQSPAACDKGLATLGITDKEKIIGLDMYCRKESYTAFFDYVNELRKHIPMWKCLLFENDFNQWNVAMPYYEQWCKQRKTTLPIIRHLASQLATAQHGADKESRFLNLVYPHQTGQILYDESIMKTPDFEKYKAQYCALGKDKNKLDALDAMATAFILIWRYKTSAGSSFKVLKERTYGRLNWFRKA